MCVTNLNMNTTKHETLNFLDCLVELCEYLQQCKTDINIAKEDTVDGATLRCHYMIGKTLCTPQLTSMSVQGWSRSVGDIINES